MTQVTQWSAGYRLDFDARTDAACVWRYAEPMAKTMTQKQIWMARAIAFAADAAQIVLFPFFVGGLPEGADLAVDIGTAALLCWLCGFHVAFLPTFIAEALPAVDLVPSWTIAVLVATRQSRVAAPNPDPRAIAAGETH
jgi:hypothetical protein